MTAIYATTSQVCDSIIINQELAILIAEGARYNIIWFDGNYVEYQRWTGRMTDGRS